MSNKSRRIPTKEEYEKDKEIILSSYKAGLPVRRMIAKFNYTRSYIIHMKDTLISEGLITEDEIKIAFENYLKENPAAHGLDKSKVRKHEETKKAEKRHSQSIEKKEKVFELVRQRYTKSQIAKKLKITLTSVSTYIKMLIEERQNSRR